MERVGKGKVIGKWKRKAFSSRRPKEAKMNAWGKNSGFKKLDSESFDWIFDFDENQHSLWLVPLARLPATNPVYAHKPGGQSECHRILRDLSDSPQKKGIMAIGALEYGSISHLQRDFICAKVQLAIGQEGWINVAMRENRWANGEWMMYLKVVLINDPCFC